MVGDAKLIFSVKFILLKIQFFCLKNTLFPHWGLATLYQSENHRGNPLLSCHINSFLMLQEPPIERVCYFYFFSILFHESFLIQQQQGTPKKKEEEDTAVLALAQSPWEFGRDKKDELRRIMRYSVLIIV